MKGLYRYLSPFSPDQSGAVAVLYELGGIAQTERRVLGGHKGPGCHPRSR